MKTDIEIAQKAERELGRPDILEAFERSSIDISFSGLCNKVTPLCQDSCRL